MIHAFTIFVWILFAMYPSLAAAEEESPFSLWVGASEYGGNTLKIRGYLPEELYASYFTLDITGFKDGIALEQRQLPGRPVPEFNVTVDTRRIYSFTMSAYSKNGDLILESETISNIHSAKYTNAVTSNHPSPVVKQSPVPQFQILGEGLEASLDEIQCDKFPYINALVTVKYDDVVIEGLTEQNFAVLDSGLSPAEPITVFPPQSGGGVRIADFAFVFDHSGSMNDDLERLRSAIGNFTSALSQSDIDFNLAFVPYENNPTIKQDMTSSTTTFLNAVDHFLNNWPSGGIENAFLAIQTAVNSLNWRPGSQKVIILITDEDDDNGGPTLSAINDILVTSQSTVYAVIRSGFGHADTDFCEAGSVTDVTGGRCYSIYTPDFNDILDDITQTVASKYIISYKTSNLDTSTTDRPVEITVSYDGDEVTITKNYNISQCNQIDISLTAATEALSSSAQRRAVALPIAAQVVSFDPNRELTVTLFYRNEISGYVSVVMTDNGNDIFSATIPGTAVLEPAVAYYIRATEGTVTVTMPSVNASENPYIISVLPNLPPRIDHTPSGSASPDTDLALSATISDATNQIETVIFFYREKGSRIYKSLQYSVQQTQYTLDVTIPAAEVVAPGIEYYIQAIDDFNARSQSGTADSPNFIYVSSSNSTPTNSLDVSRLRIWADQITETDPGKYDISGNIRIGTVVGNSPLVSVDAAMEADTNTGSAKSKSKANVVALNVRRNAQKAPEDIPLFFGSFNANGTSAELSLSNDVASTLRLIGRFLLGWCQLCPTKPALALNDDNTMDLKGLAVELNSLNAFASIKDLKFDQSGNQTTGKLELKPDDFGLTEIKLGTIALSDFVFELDFIRPSITLGGAVGIGGQRIKIPKLPVLNIEKIGTKFTLLLDPFYIDGMEFSAGLRGPTLLNPAVLSFPQSPPATVGIAPTKFSFGVQNLSAGWSGARFIGTIDGAMVDTALIDQLFKIAATKWPVSGQFSVTIDLSGGVELAGNAKLLERFPLAAAKFIMQYNGQLFYTELSGNITLLSEALDIMVGAVKFAISASEGAVTISGNQKLTLKIPNTAPFVGGWELTSQEVGSLIICKKDGLDKAEFYTTLKVLFSSYTVRVDLATNTWTVSDVDSPPQDVQVSITGYDTLSTVAKTEKGPGILDVNTTVEVPAGENVVLVRIISETDAALFSITTPGNVTYQPQDAPPDPSSPLADTVYFSRNTGSHEAYWAINQPDAGTYTLNITNENDIGSYEIRVLGENAKPDIQLTSPAVATPLNPGEVLTIQWTDSDPDDDAVISLYFDTDDTDANGSLIVDGLREDDAGNSYDWTVPEGLYGPFYVYARIDDGNLGPVIAYSSGQFVLPDPPAPSTPASVLASAGDGSASLTWDLNDSSENVVAYKVFIRSEGQTFNTVLPFPPYESQALANGVTYELAVSAVDENGLESPPSTWQAVFPSGTSTDGPPDLEVDPNATLAMNGNMLEATVTVRNVGSYTAHGYSVVGWYDTMSPEQRMGEFVYGSLAPNTEQTVMFTLDLTQLGSLCALKQLYVQVKDVVLDELNLTNNIVMIQNDAAEIVDTRRIELEPGWNLVALPYDPASRQIGDVLDVVLSDTQSVWGFDVASQKWTVYTSQYPQMSDLTEMSGGRGYWIYMDTIGEICSSGQNIGQIDLIKGWNLVGLPSTSDTMSVTDAIADISDQVISIWGYSSGTWRNHRPDIPEASDLTTLVPGVGYWIEVGQDVTWYLP